MTAKPKTTDEIKSADRWSVLERAAASSSLKRAARLRELLFHAAGKSLKEGNKELHEQEIGHYVFGRDSDYDTSPDNIVRVSATELRKRIDSYIEGDGAGEPLILGIPRGSYSPVFRWRTKEVDAPETSLPKRLGLSYRSLPLLLISLIGVFLAIDSCEQRICWRDCSLTIIDSSVFSFAIPALSLRLTPLEEEAPKFDLLHDGNFGFTEAQRYAMELAAYRQVHQFHRLVITRPDPGNAVVSNIDDRLEPNQAHECAPRVIVIAPHGAVRA